MSKVDKRISKFFSKYPSFEYKKGESILKPGKKPDNIYHIFSGYVKSYSVNENGDILVINIYKPNNYFPITEALAERVNPYFFEAITDLVVQKTPYEKVMNFIREDDEILFDLTKRISTGLEGFMIRTQYLLRTNARQKITSSLVLLSRRFGETINDNKIKIFLPQTHEDIANLSGTSRETASIELMKLKKSSIIEFDKKNIIINDFEKLKELSVLFLEDEPLPYDF